MFLNMNSAYESHIVSSIKSIRICLILYLRSKVKCTLKISMCVFIFGSIIIYSICYTEVSNVKPAMSIVQAMMARYILISIYVVYR